MRRPNTLHLDEDFLQEPSDDELQRDKRRSKWVARTVGVTVVGLLGLAVYADQEVLDGMVTDGFVHDVGVLIHKGAVAAEDGLQWVVDNTPAH